MSGPANAEFAQTFLQTLPVQTYRRRGTRDIPPVRAELAQRSLLQSAADGAAHAAQLQLLATDGVERFAKVGGRFLGAPLDADRIELVDF